MLDDDAARFMAAEVVRDIAVWQTLNPRLRPYSRLSGLDIPKKKIQGTLAMALLLLNAVLASILLEPLINIG